MIPFSSTTHVPGRGWLSANITDTALYSSGGISAMVGRTSATMGMNEELEMVAMSAAKEYTVMELVCVMYSLPEA